MTRHRKFVVASSVSFVVAAVAIVVIILISALAHDPYDSSLYEWAWPAAMFLTIYLAFPAVIIGILLAAIAGVVYAHTKLDQAGVYESAGIKTKKKPKKKKKRPAARKSK